MSKVAYTKNHLLLAETKVTASFQPDFIGCNLNSHPHICHLLDSTVCAGDGGQVGSAAIAGGGSRPRQGGAAQPAGGGEEVGARTCSSSLTLVSSVGMLHQCIRFGFNHRDSLKEKRPVSSLVWQKSGRSAVSCGRGLHHQRRPGGNVRLYKPLLN